MNHAGHMSPAVCFGIQGKFRFTFDRTYEIQSGDIVGLPGGMYHLETVGEPPWKLINVDILIEPKDESE